MGAVGTVVTRRLRCAEGDVSYHAGEQECLHGNTHSSTAPDGKHGCANWRSSSALALAVVHGAYVIPDTVTFLFCIESLTFSMLFSARIPPLFVIAA